MRQYKLYEATQSLLSGEVELEPSLGMLRSWVESQVGIKILNIVQDTFSTLANSKQARLTLIVESDEDYSKLYGDRPKMQKKYREFISHTYISILKQAKMEEVKPSSKGYILDAYSMAQFERTYTTNVSHSEYWAGMLHRLKKFNVTDVVADRNNAVIIFDSAESKLLANSRTLFHIERIYYEYMKLFSSSSMPLSDLCITYDSQESVTVEELSIV